MALLLENSQILEQTGGLRQCFGMAGKVVLITGSTRGIGWAAAQVFAREGAVVVLNGRHLEQTEERARRLREEFGTTVMAVAGDVADPAAVKDCYRAIFAAHRRLDVLVNNAGVLQDALLGMIPERTIREVVDTNLMGAIYHLQEAARLMGRNGGGSVINISSIIGRVGNVGQAVYGASKAAILGLTMSAAKELAPKNIRVNAVAPGFIHTDMVKQLPQEKFDERMRGIRMGRIGQPEEVANTILFLASDLASYITGQVIGVDGGMLV